MPHVIVKVAAGHATAEKQDLAEQITASVMAALGSPADEVSVAVEEVPASEWMTRVYEPDIAGHWNLLLKRAGYGPLA